MRLIQQLDASDCGAACLAMILDHYKGSHSIAKIRELAGTDQNGTNLAGLVRAGEALGLETRALKGSPEALPGLRGRPFIAHLLLKTGEGATPHFVVVKSIRGRRITIYDPKYGIIREPLDNFPAIWTGYVVVASPLEDYRPQRAKQGLFQRFFPMLRKFLNLLFLVASASLILTVFGVVSSFYFRYLIDEILPSRSSLTLNVISIGILILTLFQVILEAVRKKLLLYFSLRVDNGIIYAYFHHVLSLPMSFFDSRMSGDIISRFSQVAQIRAALSDAALTLVMDTLMVVAIGAVLLLQSSALFVIAIVSVPLVSLVVWIFSRIFAANYQKLMSESADVQSNLVESILGIATIKALNAEEQARDEFDRRQSKVTWTSYRLGSLEINQGTLIGLINGWAGNLIYWIGSAAILHESMSLGQLISFNVLLGFFLGPLQRLVNLQPHLQQAFAAADRVGEIFDLKSDNEDQRSRLRPRDINGPIEFSSISFRYGTRKPVLQDLSLVVPRGKQVAFVGPSGSGKSTLVKLLLKFYIPESGTISINGVNLLDIDACYLKANIGYVPQDVILFSGSVAENIRLGAQDSSLEMAMAAAARSGALAFINSMPERFDSLLSESGNSLSGGERQRLALARAIVGNPSLIIFDEATSNLDSLSERRILDTLKTLRGRDTTVILIAHRLSTVMDSDIIYVLADGRIAESGSHESLLRLRGSYAKMWTEGLP